MSTVLSSETLAEERDEGLHAQRGSRIVEPTGTADRSLWELMDTRPFWGADDTFTGVAYQTSCISDIYVTIHNSIKIIVVMK